MSFVESLPPIYFPEVILFQKEFKICQGCQIRSINIKNRIPYDPDIGVIQRKYKKKEEKEFIKNYKLKEDELYTEIMAHLYGVAYKASFIVHHRADSDNCYNFDKVQINQIFEEDLSKPDFSQKSRKKCIMFQKIEPLFWGDLNETKIRSRFSKPLSQ